MENSGKKKVLIGICLVLLALILVAGGYYFYKEYKNKPTNENKDNNTSMAVAIEKEDTSSYTNTMTFRVCNDIGYSFINPNYVDYKDIIDCKNSELVDIKIKGSADRIVFYNDAISDDDTSYENMLFKYLLYKDDNKIKVFNGETRESYILNVPVGNNYKYYYLDNEGETGFDIGFVLLYSDEETMKLLYRNDVRYASDIDEYSGIIKPFDVLVVKTNKLFKNVYNVDYENGHVLYYDNNEMKVYDISLDTSKKVNIPTSIGDRNLGKCAGDYNNYINCEYSFEIEQKNFYRESYYSYKLDKVMYSDKYDYLEPLSDKYILGVIYDCGEVDETGSILSHEEDGVYRRNCEAKTLNVLSASEEKVVKSISLSNYVDEFSTIEKYGNNYFCIEQEAMDSNYCLETYAVNNEVKLLVKGKTNGTKVNKDGNLCVLKNNTLTIYDVNGKVISTANNKKLSDCK